MQLQLSQQINASTTEVWDAIVNPVKIKQYLFGTETHCNWEKGSSIRFTGEWQGVKYEDKGTILEIETNRLLRYDYWSSFSNLPDDKENYQTIEMRLEQTHEYTILHLTQLGIKSQEARDHSIENWKLVLEGLKQVAESN